MEQVHYLADLGSHLLYGLAAMLYTASILLIQMNQCVKALKEEKEAEKKTLADEEAVLNEYV